jgi:hypothetical protein
MVCGSCKSATFKQASVMSKQEQKGQSAQQDQAGENPHNSGTWNEEVDMPQGTKKNSENLFGLEKPNHLGPAAPGESRVTTLREHVSEQQLAAGATPPNTSRSTEASVSNFFEQSAPIKKLLDQFNMVQELLKNQVTKTALASETKIPEPKPQRLLEQKPGETVQFFEVWSSEDVRTQILQLGYAMEKRSEVTSEIKHTIKWQGKNLGVLTNEPLKGKWVITTSVCQKPQLPVAAKRGSRGLHGKTTGASHGGNDKNSEPPVY